MDTMKISDELDIIDSKPIREIIDSPIYIIVATRPDICYTVTRLSLELEKPNFIHLTKAKHVLRYFKDTINQSQKTKKSRKPLKLGFWDANLD